MRGRGVEVNFHLHKDHLCVLFAYCIIFLNHGKQDVNASLVVCTECSGTAADEPPEVFDVDHVGILDLDEVIKPHSRVFEH